MYTNSVWTRQFNKSCSMNNCMQSEHEMFTLTTVTWFGRNIRTNRNYFLIYWLHIRIYARYGRYEFVLVFSLISCKKNTHSLRYIDMFSHQRKRSPHMSCEHEKTRKLLLSPSSLSLRKTYLIKSWIATASSRSCSHFDFFFFLWNCAHSQGKCLTLMDRTCMSCGETIEKAKQLSELFRWRIQERIHPCNVEGIAPIECANLKMRVSPKFTGK